MANYSKEIMLKSHANELVKQYLAYDGSNRMEYVYTAYPTAIHGDPCVRTQYVYNGASTRITKMAETQGTWDSSYDI